MIDYPVSFIAFSKKLPLTLTSMRKAVLFSLWRAEKPLKVYDILDYLNGVNSHATATSVYRALDFFMNAGLLHKVESIQAFTLCHSPDAHHTTEILFVCDQCRGVTEVYNEEVRGLLTQLASTVAFKMGTDVVELKGICLTCQSS